MDEKRHLLATPNADGIATATIAVSHTVTGVQGAVTINDKYYMTDGGTGDVVTFSWLEGQKVYEKVFPGVPQDVTYQPDHGLWSVMEKPGIRDVAAVNLAGLGGY